MRPETDDIPPHDRRSTTLFAASVFLLLFGLYVLKPARDGLIAGSSSLGAGKADLKAWTILIQAVAMVALAPLYIRVARRVSRRWMLVSLGGLFALQLVALWANHRALGSAGSSHAAIALYVSAGIFSLVMIAEFWAFAVDFFGDERGKRIIPLLALAGSAGAVAGAWVVSQGVECGLLDTPAVLPIAAVALLAASALVWQAGSAERSPRRASARTSVGSPLALVLSHKYLLAAALVVAAVNWVSTTGETLLFASVQTLLESEAASRGVVEASALRRFVADGTTAFYASFFLWANVGTLLLQALLTVRSMPLRGLRPLLFALPIVAILSYSAAALVPMLGVLKVLKVAETATSRSVASTASHLLWLPTSRDMKRRAKALVDTVFVRLGDVMAVLTLFVGTHLLQLSTRQLYAVNVALAAVWLSGAVVLAREHARLSARRLHQAFCRTTVPAR